MVVLAVAATVEIDIQELWVAFETGRHFGFIPAQEIPLALTSLDLFLYSMHIRGVIRYHHLAQRERSQHGELGKYLKTLL